MKAQANKDLVRQLQETVWDYYARHGRVLPWRIPETDGTYDPYKVVVSELMLQQTQVKRVITKYDQFLAVFPTVESLSNAPLGTVLTVWSGLGYNRRAKFLWQLAQKVVQDYGGTFPATQTELQQLPGIGVNTAAAICAYAYNQPSVFIETNIRTVFLHHFFTDQTNIPDAQLMPLVAQACDQEHPREWYWALMDYGVRVKSTIGNVSRNSKHYSKQSTFAGSKRQIRGRIISLLTTRPHSALELHEQVVDDRVDGVIEELLQENLIARTDDILHL